MIGNILEKEKKNLKDCPFCNTKDLLTIKVDLYKKINGNVVESFIFCSNCGCSGPNASLFKSKIEENDKYFNMCILKSIEKWNEREII